MGRAIDMENDIYILKQEVERLQNTVRGMVSRLDSLDEKSSKALKVNLTEDVGALDAEDLGSTITGGMAKTCKMEVVKDEKEETDNEGDGKSSKQSNKRNKTKSSSNK